MAKLPAGGGLASLSKARLLIEEDKRVPDKPFLYFRSDRRDEIFHPGLPPDGSVVWPAGTVVVMTVGSELVRLLSGVAFNLPDGRPGRAIELPITDTAREEVRRRVG